ncbi:MAG: helix-turn-helix domain-containing protein [Paracoccaceae bacterium]
MTPELKEFGHQVRKARTALGWTLENLAHEALGNADRKSYVSKVENGRQPLSALNIQKFAKALELDDAIVDPALRASGTVEELINPRDRESDLIFGETAELRAQLKINDGLAIGLAIEYAEGTPENYEAAIAGLRQALEMAAADRARGRLPSNTSEAVDQVMVDVDAANDEQRFDDGMVAIRAEAAASEDREAQEQSARGRLFDKGILQARFTRDADMAAEFELAKINLEASDDVTRYFGLSVVQRDWFDRGEKDGLNFDLRVAIVLGRLVLGLAQGRKQRRNAMHGLGNALRSLGERESSSAHLQESLSAFQGMLKEISGPRHRDARASALYGIGAVLARVGERENVPDNLLKAEKYFYAALKIWTRKRKPQDWAMAQVGLSGAQWTLGTRDSNPARIKNAISALREALKEWTQDRAPLEWAMTTNNLGTVLWSLGKLEGDPAHINGAIAAFLQTLKERTKERVPLQWADTKNNLGLALTTLGGMQGDARALAEAALAYDASLTEGTRNRVPMAWAQTHLNKCKLALVHFDLKPDAAYLDAALSALNAAREVYTEAEASQFLGECDEQQAEIVKRRAEE